MKAMSPPKRGETGTSSARDGQSRGRARNVLPTLNGATVDFLVATVQQNKRMITQSVGMIYQLGPPTTMGLQPLARATKPPRLVMSIPRAVTMGPTSALLILTRELEEQHRLDCGQVGGFVPPAAARVCIILYISRREPNEKSRIQRA